MRPLPKTKPLSKDMQDMPLTIVGSSKFGQYSKISSEQTFNMYVSDEWLVPYPGYLKVEELNAIEGRAIYTSINFNHLIQVSDNSVYIIDSNLAVTKIGSLNTFTGDVFIAENNNNQIAICDKSAIWIFNYVANTFTQASIDFIPGYISFHNGRFLAAATGTNVWRLSAIGDGTSWPDDSQHVGLLQTKPDNVVAVVPIPGKGNNILVFGSTVAELWTDVGAQLFPYVRNSSFNIDYGCINPATIAFSDTFIAWIGINERSGPVVMVSSGGNVQKISTDGIDFRFGRLINPEDSYGFFILQDGHLFYQFTFPNSSDNLSLTYDFNTGSFYTLTDQYMNYHIAKRMAFFNNTYFFVSFTDGDTYNMDSNFTNYNGNEIPRVRVCNTIRFIDASRFIGQSIVFTIEQGESNNPQRVDCSLSRDGGQSFGSYVGRELNSIGLRQNILTWNEGLGLANELTPQFRFFGLDRFTATDGVMRIFQ